MHEMRTARRLVDQAVERMAGERAGRVIDVEVVLDLAARLSAESVRRQFDLAAHGTPVEGAAIHLRLAPSRYWCVDCMFEFSSLAPGGGACPRCGRRVLSLEREAAAHVISIGLSTH